MKQIDYSIIIPHHNTASELQRLLDSIPSLPEVEIQIIVVDDASDADTVEHLHHLQLLFDDRVEWIFLSQNVGGGAARNLGLSRARGEHILLADADDFFLPSFRDILLKYQTDRETDIIYCNAIALDSATLLPTINRAAHLQRYIALAKDHPAEGELCLRYLFGEPWCRIMRRSFLEEYALQFEPLRSHNDTRFGYESGYNARRIMVESTAIYCITQSPVSVYSREYVGKVENRVAVFARKNRFLSDHHVPIFDYALIVPFEKALSHGRIAEFRRLMLIAVSNGMSRQQLWWHIVKKLFLRFIPKKDS